MIELSLNNNNLVLLFVLLDSRKVLFLFFVVGNSELLSFFYLQLVFDGYKFYLYRLVDYYSHDKYLESITFTHQFGRGN